MKGLSHSQPDQIAWDNACRLLASLDECAHRVVYAFALKNSAHSSRDQVWSDLSQRMDAAQRQGQTEVSGRDVHALDASTVWGQIALEFSVAEVAKMQKYIRWLRNQVRPGSGPAKYVNFEILSDAYKAFEAEFEDVKTLRDAIAHRDDIDRHEHEAIPRRAMGKHQAAGISFEATGSPGMIRGSIDSSYLHSDKDKGLLSFTLDERTVTILVDVLRLLKAAFSTVPEPHRPGFSLLNSRKFYGDA
jgi:hypothetical protein